MMKTQINSLFNSKLGACKTEAADGREQAPQFAGHHDRSVGLAPAPAARTIWKRHKLEHLILVITLLVCLAGSVQADVSLKAPFPEVPEVILTFDLGGAHPEWSLVSQKAERARYTWQGYLLDLKLEKHGFQTMLHFELKPPAGARLSVKSYGAKVTLPKVSLHAVMVPTMLKIAQCREDFNQNKTLYRCLIKNGFEEGLYPKSDAPFVLITDDKGINGAAIGWAATDRATVLAGKLDGGSYVLSLNRHEDIPFTGRSLKDALVMDTKNRPWMEAEEAYARTFDRYNGRKHAPAPDWTSDAVYCTWYCYGDKINQEGVLKIARKCKELGFGTILIDAGWDSNTGGGYIDWETGILGDYIARPDRFPDMPGLVKQMHEMGLRVMLWCAPFWEGKKSTAYQEKTSSWHMHNAEGVMHELCPRHPEVRKHFFESFAWLAKTYDIDGMWIDAADAVGIECRADHPHLDQQMGAAFVDCLAEAAKGLRSIRPDAITEARVMHGNLNTKRAFDVIQPSDAPEKYEDLRLAGIHLRPWCYDIRVKNDPMFWKKKLSGAGVGKFLATMVCNGVPALSVDYLTAPEEHCRVTKAWLDFYHQHKELLLKGKFSLFGADFGSPDMMIVGRDEAVVYLKNPATTEVALPKAVKKIYLLNCTDSDTVNLKLLPANGKLRMTSYAPDWTQSGEPVTVPAADGGAIISGRIPQGGAALIKRD